MNSSFISHHSVIHHILHHQFHRTFLKIKMIILLSFIYSNLAQHQSSIIEHQTAQFTSEWEATVNRRIWMILPRGAAEFRKPTRRIWQNFHGKLWSLIISHSHIIIFITTYGYYRTHWVMSLFGLVFHSAFSWVQNSEWDQRSAKKWSRFFVWSQWLAERLAETKLRTETSLNPKLINSTVDFE